MQENPDFAEKAIAEWEEIKKSGFWKIFLEELDREYTTAAKMAAQDPDVEEILRWQGEYRAIDRIGRIPIKIVKYLKESGIPDKDIVGPDLK